MDLNSWLLSTINSELIRPAWLDERRFDFVSILENAISQFLEPRTMVLITDRTCSWFDEYLLHSINQNPEEPFAWIISLRKIMPSIDKIEQEDLPMIIENLNTMFNNNYFFWYIGRHNSGAGAALALSRADSFVWLSDLASNGTLEIPSKDGALDIRILQAFRIFIRALYATTYGEIEFKK